MVLHIPVRLVRISLLRGQLLPNCPPNKRIRVRGINTKCFVKACLRLHDVSPQQLSDALACDDVRILARARRGDLLVVDVVRRDERGTAGEQPDSGFCQREQDGFGGGWVGGFGESVFLLREVES